MLLRLMRVDHRRLDVLMAENLPHGSRIDSIHLQQGIECVSCEIAAE